MKHILETMNAPALRRDKRQDVVQWLRSARSANLIILAALIACVFIAGWGQ